MFPGQSHKRALKRRVNRNFLNVVHLRMRVTSLAEHTARGDHREGDGDAVIARIT